MHDQTKALHNFSAPIQVSHQHLYFIPVVDGLVFRNLNIYLGTDLLCLFFHLLCYAAVAAVLIKFTYYAQNYAQE